MDKKVDATLVCNMREKYPCMTLKQIGDEFGICRERVRQLLKRENMITGQYKPPYICKQCNTTYFTTRRHQSKIFCSNECSKKWISQHKAKTVTVKCNACGKDFEITFQRLILHPRDKRYHDDKFYGDKKCYGKWLGKNFGKYNLKNHKPRKYDYEYVWQKHLETGYGAVRLSRLLNIPAGTLGCILSYMRKKGFKE